MAVRRCGGEREVIGAAARWLGARLHRRRGRAGRRAAGWDPELRAEFLIRLAAALPAVTTLEQLQLAATPPPRAGVAREEIISYPPTAGVRLRLAPPEPAVDVARIAGISRPTAKAVDVHQRSWCLAEAGEPASDQARANPHTGYRWPRIGSCRLVIRLERHPVLDPDYGGGEVAEIEVILDGGAP